MKQRTTIIFGKKKGTVSKIIETAKPFLSNIAQKIRGRSTQLASDVIDNTFDDFEESLRSKGFLK